MANIDAAFSFRLYSAVGGPNWSLREMTTASNATLAIGDPVSLASGLVTLTLTTQAIFGVAMEAVTGATGVRKTVLVRPAQDSDVYIVQTTGSVCSEAVLGGEFDLSGTSGLMEVNLAGTTAPPVRVIGFAPDQTVAATASTHANVLVTIKKNAFTGQA